MCGVCGLVDFSGLDPAAARALPDMVATLHHRGPDQSGTWSDSCAALGHARLSIIDLTDGRQPLSNEDGTVWVSYNGEVYNFRELREDLLRRGHRFRTNTDTEVIVHLYEDEGIEAVQRFRGMFAFALWDARKECLYLVRDRLGIKPLFYTLRGECLVFGSEIKAILACPGIPRRLRPEALSDYLTFQYVPSPKTMFADVFKLPAGHWLRFDRQGIAQQEYWDLEPQPPFAANRRQLEEQLIELLHEAVRLRLVSDVPLGAFLSGGVDSSGVVAMMARAGQDPLVTVSIGFDESDYNELPFARLTARRYATRHYEEIVRPEAVEIVEKLAWHFDEPFADFSSIPTFYVSQAARRHVTVALSGDGGDENFGGYPRYRWHLFEQSVRRWLPGWFRTHCLGPLARAWPDASWLPRPLRARQTLERIALDPLAAYLRAVGFLDDTQKQEVLTGDLVRTLGDYRSADVIRHYLDRGGRRGLDQLSYAEIKTYLVDDILTKVDRTSMAVALEVRVPLLDHLLVAFASRVPSHMKIEGRNGKAILKSALRPYVDRQALYRRKTGFSPPLGQWMRGPLRGMLHDLLLAPDTRSRDYLRPAAVRGFMERHAAGENFTHVLWAFLMFEWWCRKFL